MAAYSPGQAICQLDSSSGSETEQKSTSGAAHVVNQGLGAGEDLQADVQRISDGGTATYIATATTTVCATGRGVLKSIAITETAAGAITVYDNTAASGTILGVFKASIAEQDFRLGWNFSIGLTVVTAGASKLTAVTGK